MFLYETLLLGIVVMYDTLLCMATVTLTIVTRFSSYADPEEGNSEI